MMIRLILCLYVFIQSAFSFLDEGKLKDAVGQYAKDETNLLVQDIKNYTKNGKRPTDTQILDYLNKDKDFNFENKITLDIIHKEAQNDCENSSFKFPMQKALLLSDFVVRLYAGEIAGYTLSEKNPSATPVNKNKIAKVLFRAGQWAQMKIIDDNLDSHYLNQLINKFENKSNKNNSRLKNHFSNCKKALEDSKEKSFEKLKLRNYHTYKNYKPLDYVNSWQKYLNIETAFSINRYPYFLFFRNYLDQLNLEEIKKKIAALEKFSGMEGIETVILSEFSIEDLNKFETLKMYYKSYFFDH